MKQISNKEYEKYHLDMDLYKNLQRIKNSGKILTVHRYGSSNIYGDNDLVPKSLPLQGKVARSAGRGRSPCVIDGLSALSGERPLPSLTKNASIFRQSHLPLNRQLRCLGKALGWRFSSQIRVCTAEQLRGFRVFDHLFALICEFDVQYSLSFQGAACRHEPLNERNHL